MKVITMQLALAGIGTILADVREISFDVLESEDGAKV